MARLYVYADESGDFNFSREPKASKYFVLTTVLLTDLTVGDDLLALRRELAWRGVDLPREFHATHDQQAVRDQVFQVIASHDFRVDVTILNKPKTKPYVRATATRFYKTAWFFHMKHIAPRIVAGGDELLVVAGSVGTKRKRKAFYGAVQDVIHQVSPSNSFQVAFWPAAVDPCLQVADYCCWAVQRKWEMSDERSYVIIKDRIRSEFDMFRIGTVEYY